MLPAWIWACVPVPSSAAASTSARNDASVKVGVTPHAIIIWMRPSAEP